MVITVKRLVQIIGLSLLIVATGAKIYISSIDVIFNRLYLLDHRVTVRPDRVSMDSIMNLAQTFPYDPWIKIDNNLCETLGKSGTNFMIIWKNNLLKHSNFPKHCPIEKGNYSWTNLRADVIGVPNFISGLYKVTIETYFRKKSLREFVANLTLHAELK